MILLKMHGAEKTMRGSPQKEPHRLAVRQAKHKVLHGVYLSKVELLGMAALDRFRFQVKPRSGDEFSHRLAAVNAEQPTQHNE
jgi:hypothetical protein